MYVCDYRDCGFKIRSENVIKNHCVREHGIVYRNKYTLNQCTQDTTECPKRRGQTKCTHCGIYHNNNGRPDNCKCGQKLTKVSETKPNLSAHKLTGDIFSVRKNVAGIAKRVIVDMNNKICYSLECLEARVHYNIQEDFMCAHLRACRVGYKHAMIVKIELSQIVKYIQNEDVISELKKVQVDGKISVFLLSDNIAALSVLADKSHNCPSGMVHINMTILKCPLQKCANLPRAHHLVKADSLCIHTLLLKLVNSDNDLSSPKKIKRTESTEQFSKTKTVEKIVNKIIENIPSSIEAESEKIFLQNSLNIQQELRISKDASKYESIFCDKCHSRNIVRNRPGNGLLVTPGHFCEIKFNTFVCKKCNVVNYPDMTHHGIVPICDTLLVSWSFIVMGRDFMQNGSKLYNHCKQSLRRLCLENKECSKKFHLFDFHNYAIKISKCIVSYNSATLIKSETDCDALSQMLCIHCGLCPTILSSDGNAKNSIFLKSGSENIVFEENDKSDIMNLQDFLKLCIVNVAGTSIFQHYPKQSINVYKLPPVLSKVISNQIRNRESLKKSAFLQNFDLGLVDFNAVLNLVTSGEFDILKSRKLDLKTLRCIGKKINIPHASKLSKVMLGMASKSRNF